MKAVPLSHRWCWPLLIGAVAVVGSTLRETARGQRPVGYAEARTVVNRRCIECHSEQPTNRAFPIAPQGVMLDTALRMKQFARRIEARVVVERTMPLANMSGMTDEERRVLGRWVETGQSPIVAMELWRTLFDKSLRADQIIFCSPLVDPYQPAEWEEALMDGMGE